MPTPSTRPSLTPTKQTSTAKKQVCATPDVNHCILLSRQALLRDGYRCWLSGSYDYESVQTRPPVKAMAKEAWSNYVRTECCHIFSEDTLQSAGEGENQAGGASFLSTNIDCPTEETCCYCVRSVGKPWTSMLGSALEWKWCTFVGEYHHDRYVASPDLRLPRAVIGTTSC